MSTIEHSIDIVRRAHEAHGAASLAKASGVALTTIGALKKRGFSSNSLEIMMRLVEAAQSLEAGAPSGEQIDAA